MSRGADCFNDRGHRVAAIENVIEEQDMSSVDIREGGVIEFDPSCRYRASVVAHHTKTIEAQREWNSSEKIRHKYEAAVQHGKHTQLFTSIVLGNFSG